MTRTTNIITAIVIAAVSVLTAACSGNTVYSEFRGIPQEGWDKDSTLVFEVNITDTLAAYDIVLSVRHGQDYPYQNIWFFVDNDRSMQADTLEYYLADQRGRWLGNGFGDKKDMPCLIAQTVRFPHAGIYTYRVRHGMREDLLQGVCEVGLTVDKQ